MAIAAIWGTTAGYTDYLNGTVIVETNDGRVAVFKKDTFDYLYFKLDEFTAALKEYCIHYAIYEPGKKLFEYPTWFVDAVADGYIYEQYQGGLYMFYQEDGEIAMSPNSAVVRNYRGELMYLEGYKFHKYYDTLQE